MLQSQQPFQWVCATLSLLNWGPLQQLCLESTSKDPGNVIFTDSGLEYQHVFLRNTAQLVSGEQQGTQLWRRAACVPSPFVMATDKTDKDPPI